MLLYKKLAITASILAVCSAQAATISGVVKDKQTLVPVAGAKVVLVKAGFSGTTDSSGKFSYSTADANFSDTLVVTDKHYWEKKVPVTGKDSSNLEINLQATKQRLIVTTDIGGTDPDDRESMVHLLMLSNEYDLEGLICAHSWVLVNPVLAKQRISNIIDAYEQVVPNLRVHAEGYPSAEYLHSILKVGQAKPLVAGTGEGKDGDGSKLIIEAVDKKDDPRPVWINAWGGANDIAQAFWKVKNTRTPEEVKKFVNKIRVYDVLGQCDSGSWIAKNFPDVFYIRNSGGVYGWAPPKSWTGENIQSHGPMGKIYPTAAMATEGDSPAFFHISSRGLNDPDQLTQGGWGGRFLAEKKTGVKLFSWADKNPAVSATEQSVQPYALYTDAPDCVATMVKWKQDIYNDFAVRMDWSVKSNRTEANHFPVAVLNGDATRQILDATVRPGEQVTLDASASKDPDGNALTYSWQFEKEASSYTGTVAIQGDATSTAKVTVPADASGKNIHIILVLRDNGTPSLHAYRRMILNVK